MIENILRKGYYFFRNAGVGYCIKLQRNKFLPENAIIITGSPRSGTTWLSDIFSMSPTYSSILEPLHPSNKGFKELGFSWRTFIHPDKVREDVKEYFKKVFTGATANVYNTIDTPFLKIIGTKKWVVKFIRANRLLPWLITNFKFKYKPVLIARHPCGIVYSQIKHPLFTTPEKVPEYDIELIEGNFPQFKHLLKKAKTEEEIRTLTWGLDNYIPLHYLTPQEYILVSYEELVLHGFEVLKRIYSTWGISVPHDSLSQLRKKSKEAKKWAEFDEKGRKKLGVWKKYLTKKQINSILDIVNEMGFSEFTEDIEPNYNKLKGKH